MGIIDVLLMDNGNITKGFDALTKGNSYSVAYNKEGKIVAYTTGVDVGKQLIEKYIEENNLSKNDVKVEKEFYKKKDEFFTINEEYQICIVDKKVMLKCDVRKIMESEELTPGKNNKMMSGLDTYTKKSK